MLVVGLPVVSVEQTTMPRAWAASTSSIQLRLPVEIRSRRSGSASIRRRGNAVRSRVSTTMSKPLSARAISSGPPSGASNTVNSTSPARLAQSASPRATFW